MPEPAVAGNAVASAATGHASCWAVSMCTSHAEPLATCYACTQMDLAVVVEMARFIAVAAALHVQSMLHAMAASLVVVVLYLQSWTALAVVDAVHMLSALPAGPAFVPKQTAQLPKPKVQLPEVLIEATLTLVDCVRSRPDGKQAQPSPRVLSNVSSYNGSHVGTGKSLQLITCDHRPAKRQHFEGRWQRQGNGWVLAG